MNDFKKIVAIALLVLMVSAVFFVACGEDIPPADEGEGEEITPPAETEYAIQYTDDNGVHTITVKSGALYSITDMPQRTGYTAATATASTSSRTAPTSCSQKLKIFPQYIGEANTSPSSPTTEKAFSATTRDRRTTRCFRSISTTAA